MTQSPQDQPTEGGQRRDFSQPPPPFGQAPRYRQPGRAPVSVSDARTWSLFAHLGGIFVPPIPALVIYLVYRDRDPFIRHHAAQALNFQIMLVIAYMVSSWLTFILIGIVTGFLTFVCAVVFSVIAAMAANAGHGYTYPLTPTMIT
jgi:uncharacterized Tic20 family protein